MNVLQQHVDNIMTWFPREYCITQGRGGTNSENHKIASVVSYVMTWWKLCVWSESSQYALLKKHHEHSSWCTVHEEHHAKIESLRASLGCLDAGGWQEPVKHGGEIWMQPQHPICPLEVAQTEK